MNLGGIQLVEKTLDQAFNLQNQKTTFQPDTRQRKLSITTEQKTVLKHFKNQNRQKIITETLNQEPKDIDSGTMLDENNIL
jgi:hypothetical protein